jgi:hypothetical protein
MEVNSNEFMKSTKINKRKVEQKLKQKENAYNHTSLNSW